MNSMANLSTHGDFPRHLIERAKAELAGELDFAEQSEPSVRSGASMPSLGGYIETHFNFEESCVSNFYSNDLRKLRDELKIFDDNVAKGYTYGDPARAAELRRELRNKLKQQARDLQAAQAAVGYPDADGDDNRGMTVELDNRGVLIPDYKESK